MPNTPEPPMTTAQLDAIRSWQARLPASMQTPVITELIAMVEWMTELLCEREEGRIYPPARRAR